MCACPGSSVEPRRCEFNDFQILNVLDDGFFGGTYNTIIGKCHMALQLIKGEQHNEDFEKGIKHIKDLKCREGVNRILAFCHFTDPTSILMDFEPITVEGEEFSNLYMYLIYLRKKFEAGERKNFLKNRELFKFVKQIVTGMKFLEKNNIVHGDLMTRNILISQYNVLKISGFDFSKAKKINDERCLSTFISRRWAAPEVISHEQQSNYSDVWSFGMVIWEIGTLGGFPFPDLNDEYWIQVLGSENPWLNLMPLLRQMVPISFELSNIFERCWCDLNKRADFKTLCDDLKKKVNVFQTFDSLDENFRLPPTIDAYEEKKLMKTLPQFQNFRQHIKHLKNLGEGDFGTVDLIYSNKEILGHKTMVLRSIEMEKKTKTFDYEKKKLLELEEHENLVRILAFEEESTKISIFSEYVALNTPEFVIFNLYECLLGLRKDFNDRSFEKSDYSLRNDFTKSLTHKHLGSYALQIAKGMSYLEEKKISHGNLSAKNVLMSYYKTVKISDYGLTYTRFRKKIQSDDFCRWAAPEVLIKNQPLGMIESDVWSFGVVLWEIATLGAYPYGNFGMDLEDTGTPEKPKYCTNKFSDIFDRCFKRDPAQRPTFQSLVNDLQNCKETFYDFKKIPAGYTLPPSKEEIYPLTRDQNPRYPWNSPPADYVPSSTLLETAQLRCSCSLFQHSLPRPNFETPEPFHEKFSKPEVKSTKLADIISSVRKFGRLQFSEEEKNSEHPPSTSKAQSRTNSPPARVLKTTFGRGYPVLKNPIQSRINFPRAPAPNVASGREIAAAKEPTLRNFPNSAATITNYEDSLSTWRSGRLELSTSERLDEMERHTEVGVGRGNVPRAYPTFLPPVLCPYCNKNPKDCFCYHRRNLP